MSSAEAWRAWEGRVVAGKFPLRRWLGGSEHSAVFLTERQGQLSQKAAIKLIPADAGDADRQLARWRAAAQLSHPHLIRIFETGSCGTTLLYVAMEYAEEDLSQILPQRPLTPAEVTDLLPPVLDALSYLHGKGLVHGCLKPSNVMAVGEQLKISADQVTSSSQTDSRGKRRDAYDAPETAAGVISPAADVWSLGLTLVAAFTQNEPPAGEAKVPASLEKLPEPFRGIAHECLHVDPKRRCSIAQIQARLQPPARSVPAGPEPTTPAAPVRHYRYTWRMLIPVAVLLAFALALYLFHRIFQKPPASREQIEVAATPESKPAHASTPTSALHAASSTQAGVVHQVLPDAPQSALNTITGTVRVSVRVNVDSSGKVTTAELASAGPSKYFARMALAAAQRWEFVPLEVDGQPVESMWLLHFRFRRTSVQASAERARR
jgi:TonB family protein